MYSVRAAARADKHDIPVFCSDGCGSRVLYVGEKCEACTLDYCINCQSIQVENAGDYCERCTPTNCETSECNNIVIPPTTKCDDCQSVKCAHSNCNNNVNNEGTRCIDAKRYFVTQVL